MHKIDHPTATPGGLFTIGDPVGGLPATVVTADWLNAVQGEIVSVIEGAGIELDKADNAQLLAAIQSLMPKEEAWRTGDVILTLRTVAADGWIVCDDGTIGSAASGATTRAHEDCEALFKLLWDNVTDEYAPVSGGRGESAEADWSANKTIALTKMLGRALAVAGAGSGLSVRTLGQTVGAETHTLTEEEMPAHTHGPGTLGGELDNIGRGGGAGGPGGQGASHFDPIVPFAVSTGETDSTGGDEPHNNMQPTVFLCAHIKL